ncbi:MAG: hypothetical protein ACFFCS_18660 [Candidatus Hodarchaeota archaeon]
MSIKLNRTVITLIYVSLLALLLPSFVINTCQSNGSIAMVRASDPKPPFNGMYIKYTFNTTAGGGNNLTNGQDTFSIQPAGPPGLASVESSLGNRTVNITSREISDSLDPLISNGMHEWVWIPFTSQPGVEIPIAVRDSSEQKFQIVENATFNFDGKTYRCWKLVSGNGSTAYYEQSTGLLVNATFRYTSGPGNPCQDVFIMTGTNVVMTEIDSGIPDELIIGGIIGLVVIVAAIAIAQLRKRMRPGLQVEADVKIKGQSLPLEGPLEGKIPSKPVPARDLIKPVPANAEMKLAGKELKLPGENLESKLSKLEFKSEPKSHLKINGAKPVPANTEIKLTGQELKLSHTKLELKLHSADGALKPVPANTEIKLAGQELKLPHTKGEMIPKLELKLQPADGALKIAPTNAELKLMGQGIKWSQLKGELIPKLELKLQPAGGALKPVPANTEIKLVGQELKLPGGNLESKLSKVDFKVEFKSRGLDGKGLEGVNSTMSSAKPVPATEIAKPVPANLEMKSVPASEVKGAMPSSKVAKPVPGNDLEENFG